MIIKASEVDYVAHHFDEESFERFEEIYDMVCEGKAYFLLEDITELCKIFAKEFEALEPHQYVKIRSMTYLTIDRYGLEIGFQKLLDGLFYIIDYNETETEGYLNMLLSSYSKEAICIFSKKLLGYDLEFRKKIYQLLRGLETGLKRVGYKAKWILKDSDK